MSRADREDRATETKIASFTHPSADNSPRLDRLQILITDDNPTNRKLLRVLLEAEGHRTLEADNGVAALELLKHYSIDAVISDILMPEMDGYRLCYEIRKNPTLNPIPFIVYTATYISPSDEKVGLDFGADKFIVKPAPPEVIINALYEVVESTRGRRAKELKQPQELLVMREYSEALVRKLEETNLDLTEANKALAESENHLRTILDSEPECVTIINRDGALVDINRAGLQVFEADSTEQLVGKAVYLFIVPEYRQAFAEITEAVLRGESRRLEFEIVGLAGTRRWLETHAVPFKNANGEITSSLGITRDITESKRAEEALKQIPLKKIQWRKARIVKDLGIIFVLSILVFVAAEHFHLFEMVSRWLLTHPEMELGDLVLVLVCLAFAFAFFSYRRWTELKTEMVGRTKAEEALRVLHRELETRVQERTTDLAKSNEALRTEIAERKQAQEMVQLNLERIRALHEIDLAITSTLDLRQRLDVLLEKIDIFLPFPAASTIRLFNAATQKFENTACRNINEQEWKLGTGRGTGQLSREFLKTKGPVIVLNIQTDIERKNTEFFRKQGFVSYLGVPLIAKGNIVGVLGFYTREVHEFTQQEIDFLITLAGQAAVAIDNATLYEQTERRRREAEELARVARSLTETLDMTVVGERIVTSVRELFGVQGSTLRLRQADGSFRRLASSGEVFSQTSVGDSVPSGVGLTNRAIADGKPIWSSDILSNPEIVITDEMRDYQIRSGNRSMIVVPLRAHEKLIGTLTLSDRTGRIYSDNEVALLQTFADQVALALENARLYEQTERQLKRIEALREIEKTITSTLDLTTVLNVLMEKLDIFFAYPLAATVRLFDKDTGLLEPVAARNLSVGEWIAAMRGVQHNGESYGRVVIEEQAPLVIPDLQTDPRTQNPHFYREHGLISYVGVPLIAKGEVLGVLGIYTKEAHSFANEEIELLMILAGQAAIAIHNARLYEETDRSRKELETTNRSLDRSLRQLDSLHTALAPIGAVRSIQEAIGEIIDRLIEATGADAAVVRICDKHSGDYPIIGQRGYSERFIEELERANSGGATDWVIKHAEPILAPDIASEDRLRGKRQISLGLRSCAILPLRVHSEVSGVIEISSRTKGYFDEEQKDHLLAVARQMSITLENRELFYSLKASRDELERANRVKDEFLSVMSHELRTPLSVVLGYSRMFQDRQLGPLTHEQEQAVEVVLRNSQELLEMIESIMDATKIEAGSMIAEMNLVAPLELLQEIKAAYDFPIAKNVRLEWKFQEPLPLLWSDTRKLRQIVTNLINNAIKFTEEGRIVITAEEKRQSDEMNDKWLEFRVSDSGVGIPPEECDRIFDRFHQVDSSQTRRFEGVGLGLYIVKSFTEMLGGRVSVCSELGKGSTFTVSLPIEKAL